MSKHNKLVRRVRTIIISANSNSSKFNTQQTTQFHHHMSVILDFQRALFHQSTVKFCFQYWDIHATSFRGCGAVSPCLGPGSTCEEHDNTFTCYCAKVPYHQPDICHFWYATAIINLVDPGPDREVLREGDRNGRPCCCWLHWIQPCCGKSWNFSFASFHRAAIFKLTS